MKKRTKHSTKKSLKSQLSPVQVEMEKLRLLNRRMPITQDLIASSDAYINCAVMI
jgi:hypothetical protein